MIGKNYCYKIILLSISCSLYLACASLLPPPGTQRSVPPVFSGAQPGLLFFHEAGHLRIVGDFMTLTASERPAGVSMDVAFFNRAAQSLWLALVLPPPLPGIATQGQVDIRVMEAGRRDLLFSSVSYNPAEPLLLNIAALAPSRLLKLELVWPRGFVEELAVEFVDQRERPADNLFIQRSGDFSGSHDSTRLQDGMIQLAQQQSQATRRGTYTSPVFDTLPFDSLVMSWNADTPGGSAVEVEARTLRSDGLWTEWLSWGVWGSQRENANAGSTQTYARMNDDIYTLRGGMGEEAIAYQYRVNLVPGPAGAAPLLRLVAATLRNSRPGRALPKPFFEAPPAGLNIDLGLPAYSQYQRDPQFASAICSPTSLTMVLEHFGQARLVEELVKRVYDRRLGAEGGYGNWSYNVAAAAAYGFEAWVDYLGSDDATSLALIGKELQAGFPVIASVRYRNAPAVASNWPVLEGAPIASTSGHLVVIGGIFERDGRTWLVVNDSAAPDDQSVRREYRADQFLQAWDQRLAYLVRPLADFDPARIDANLPAWQTASLKPTGRTRDLANRRQLEFALFTDDGAAVSLASLARSRYLSLSYLQADGRRRYLAPGRDDSLWLDETVASAGYGMQILFTDGRQYRVQLEP